MNSILPIEFQHLLAKLATLPENVREMWRYAIVLMMIDAEKARMLGTRVADGREFIAIRTIEGEEFEVERPAMSGETEKMLLEQIREIVADEL